MKKQIFSVLAVFMLLGSFGFAMAGPVSQIELIGETPIYTEADFVPLLFLSTDHGRVLSDPRYFNGVLPENGNFVTRTNNYAFTGEQIQWKVLLWDKNGVPEKINDVFAGWVEQTNGPLDPEMQVNCEFIGPISEETTLANLGYPNVRRPIDQEAQVYGNADTMGEYLCTLTIEPSCHGQKWLGVKAIDLDGNTGVLPNAESWFCNPELDLTVSGTISFGELGSGEQGSSKFSVENSAEDGSGVQVVLAISGTDFYDPTSSGAMCSTSNQLKLQGEANQPNTGFWYSAVMGSNSVANKKIPYGNVISKADPVFSSGEGKVPNWEMNQLVPMSPGSEATMTLYLGIPQPCNGQFTDGSIYLYSWAI